MPGCIRTHPSVLPAPWQVRGYAGVRGSLASTTVTALDPGRGMMHRISARSISAMVTDVRRAAAMPVMRRRLAILPELGRDDAPHSPGRASALQPGLADPPL